jgi:hypothetical protein
MTTESYYAADDSGTPDPYINLIEILQLLLFLRG